MPGTSRVRRDARAVADVGPQRDDPVPRASRRRRCVSQRERARRPAGTSPPTELAEITDTVDELREAFHGCFREDVEVVDGIAGLEPKRKNATFGGCVLQWLEAPGSVQAEYVLGGGSESVATAWSNVTAEWPRGDRRRTANFAVEAT